MPAEVAILRLGEKVDRGSFEPMPSESHLEDILALDTSILDPGPLVMGGQLNKPAPARSPSGSSTT